VYQTNAQNKNSNLELLPPTVIYPCIYFSNEKDST
jgi:hypothetical protein